MYVADANWLLKVTQHNVTRHWWNHTLVSRCNIHNL